MIGKKKGRSGRLNVSISLKSMKRKNRDLATLRNLSDIDYKNVPFLLSATTPNGKIVPRRMTLTRTKAQKKISKAIKRARMCGLLAFKVEH